MVEGLSFSGAVRSWVGQSVPAFILLTCWAYLNSAVLRYLAEWPTADWFLSRMLSSLQTWWMELRYLRNLPKGWCCSGSVGARFKLVQCLGCQFDSWGRIEGENSVLTSVCRGCGTIARNVPMGEIRWLVALASVALQWGLWLSNLLLVDLYKAGIIMTCLVCWIQEGNYCSEVRGWTPTVYCR